MEQLNKLRTKIDQIDTEILELLEQRLSTVKQIAQAKKKLNLPTKNPKREKEIIQSWLSKINLCSPEFATKILKLILKESRNLQKKLHK